MENIFDVIVVGAGPGGYVAAIRASQLGFNTAVVERAELGGVCLNWGCIPTKALLKSAQVLNYTKHLADYGVVLGDAQGNEIEAGSVVGWPDIKKIVERERGVSATMSKGIEYLFKKNKITVIKGEAFLPEAGKVEVTFNDGENAGNKEVFEAKHIILATGARPNSLPFAPIDGEKIISYRQALVPETLPKSMAVIGSGAIGSELAFFYRSMGVEVYLIEYMDQIVPLEDADVAAQLSRSFRKAGIKVMVSSGVKAIDTTGEGCKLTVETKKGVEEIQVERVLSAVGVVPNTENLGLEGLGIELNRGKVPVDEFYRTKVEGLYAIGDIIATPALAHVASAEGIAAVEKIAGMDVAPVDYTKIPGATYTSPEIASVGMTEKKVKEAGIAYKVGKFPFTASGKATTAGEKDGFVKLIIDEQTDKLLGVHMIGANVTEMLSGMVLAMNLGATARDIIKSIHPHPTMSEAIMEAAAAAHNEVIHI
ncbi:MAG: dihydrolipoyl dehydrogenase [Bacteroidales bacterium]|nr:dihydrolipoyl dehydrogenase [Bacteroidales bacterium]